MDVSFERVDEMPSIRTMTLAQELESLISLLESLVVWSELLDVVALQVNDSPSNVVCL